MLESGVAEEVKDDFIEVVGTFEFRHFAVPKHRNSAVLFPYVSSF